MNIVSRKNRDRFLKTFTVLTAMTTMLSLSGVAYFAYGATPADYGLTEGDTISAAGSDDPDVYIVNEQGYKRLFLNPAIFGLYGHLGGFAAVKNVSPATRDAFPTSGLFRVDGTEKVYGLETTGEDVAVLHWVNTSGAQAVADDPNFFKKVFVINAAEKALYGTAADYTSVNQVPAYARGGSVPTGPLSATLASDNPASGTLLETQSMADLAHFQVNGSGVVTNLELKRLGVSGDTTITDVYLFVNGARVSDAGNVSSGMITFANGSGLFTAPANVSVRAYVADDTSGQTVGVQLTKVNTSVVSATGNVHSIAANPATLATLSVGSATGPGSFNPGLDINVWQANFTISNEDVYLKRFSVREIGSIDNTDIKNFRLFVDGVQVATDPDLDANGYATFLANHYMKSGTRVVKVVADVVGGSSRTMEFSLRGFYDVDVADESYNVSVKASNTFPVTVSAASTVGSVSVTAIKAADSPTGDVVDDSSDVALGRFTLTAFGEQVKVETLKFVASVSDSSIDSLRNSRVLINGTQYGSTATLGVFGDDASTSYSVNYTLMPGEAATVEVRADLHEATGDTDTVSDGDIISILMHGADDNNNAYGVSSATQVDVAGSVVESNNVTVQEGSMTVAKYTAYASQNVTIPNSSLKLGHYILTGGSSEDTNINTLNAGFTVAGAWAASNLSSVYIKILNSTGGLVLQTSPKATVTGADADNAYSASFTLPKSTSYHAEIWGTVSSFTVLGSDDTLITSLDTSGTSALSGATVTGSQATGQTLIAETGSITESISGSAPVDKIVAAGSTSTVHAVDFTTTNDDFTIYEMVLEMDGNNADTAATVANVIVKDGGTIVASSPLNGASVSFTGLNINVPANDTKTLTFDLQFGNVGVGYASTAMNAKLTLDSYKARDSAGSITTDTTEVDGNDMYVHKSYPSVASAALPSSVLVAGEVVMSKFNITANGNIVGLASMSWDITKSTDVVLASASSAKLYVDGNELTSAGAFSLIGGATGIATGRINFAFTSEYQIPAGTAKTFELRHTVSSMGSTGTLLTQFKMNDTAYALPHIAANAGTGANLAWTDRSATSHSYTSGDWMNDNLIKDSTSQALIK